jgi:hypothetical protein
MEPSILKSTKKVLGIGPDDTSFDPDIITYINSAFSNLHQLGIGPDDGFVIEDEEGKWADFVTDPALLPYFSLIKTCVYLRVRMLFDPPTTSYLINAMKDQIAEHEWRLSTAREGYAWVDPSPVVVDDE